MTMIWGIDAMDCANDEQQEVVDHKSAGSDGESSSCISDETITARIASSKTSVADGHYALGPFGFPCDEEVPPGCPDQIYSVALSGQYYQYNSWRV